MLKAITSKQAYALNKKLGMCLDEEHKTFYATNETETGIWEFDTKAERDKAIKASKEATK